MNESKSSLKDDSPVQEKKGFHVLIAKWEESPERNKFHELWEKHSLSIILVCLTVILLAYSIAAIAVSGFDKAKWLFGITMFLWFCMTYMFIRDHCGAEIYRVVLKPIVDLVNRYWRYLKWYVECFFVPVHPLKRGLTNLFRLHIISAISYITCLYMQGDFYKI